ncbi:MAG: membrane lipoprotein lipid attachment site-containing protein [Prevotella sp.]|nr:membrane lipoprotein lipid attachment site-containing protein [Prevotella sp.]
MKKLFLLLVAGLMLTACGNKTKSGEAQTDSLATDSVVTEKPVAEEPAVDQWTTEAVAARVNEIYQKVNELYRQQDVNLFVLDSLYCSKDYLDMYQQVEKAEEGKPFEKLCFIEYQPWDLGLEAPIKVSNIRPELLTEDMAEVYFDLAEVNGAATCTAGWTLYLEDNAWKVHSFLSGPDDHVGSWEYMRGYVEKNKK